MSLIQRLIGAGLRPRVRGQARGKSLGELISALEESRDRLLPRIRSAADTPGNREAVNHWVGIERWSQSRVRVAQGTPFQQDGYRGYRLPEGTPFAELQRAFATTREETLALARDLQRTGFDVHLKIRHNDLGPLTVPEWFAYIDDHTRREVIRLRGRKG